jgi:predicted protein tyrosine phosphatase
MIKRITVLSRKQTEQIIISACAPTQNLWALISIWNTKELLDPFSREILSKINCKETLSIRFADLTPNELQRINDKENYLLFNEKHAETIIDFLEKINLLDIDELIIHCAAGISRSGAVGLFTCRYFKLDENKFREENKQILPNFHILEVLNSVSDIDKDYIKFWETKENQEKREKLFKVFIKD